MASITLEGPDNLIRHIEGLQAKLTERNATIDQLLADNATLRDGAPTNEGLAKAYRRGYADAIGEARSAASEASKKLWQVIHLSDEAVARIADAIAEESEKTPLGLEDRRK